METTFAMIKPNAIQRGLAGEIISRFENKGLTISAMKMINVSEEQAKAHYKCHEGKSFYPNLLESITSGPVVCLAISGVNAIALVRHMAGATNPLEALPGTIRGDYSADMRLNLIHTSDSEDNAKYELGIYFRDDEIVTTSKSLDPWIFS